MNSMDVRTTGRSTWRGMLAGLALVLLTSCDLEFPEQQLVLFHDAKADRLDFLLVYRGVTASGEGQKDIEEGVAAVQRILAGRREFMLLDWPLYWDLDGKDKDAPKWLREHVKLQRVDTFVDGTGRLCAYQLFTMSKVSEGLRLLNEAIEDSILETYQKGRLEGQADVLALAELYGFLDQAAAGAPFIRLEKGRLLVDVPLPSPETIQRLVDASWDRDNWALANLLAQVRYPRLSSHGRLTLQLGESRNGMTALELRRNDVKYSPKLHEALN